MSATKGMKWKGDRPPPKSTMSFRIAEENEAFVQDQMKKFGYTRSKMVNALLSYFTRSEQKELKELDK